MNIYYQGTDITSMVGIRKCVVRDTCGDRCDSLELEFDNAARWYAWDPQEDDQIVIAHNGYDSGVMYINMIMPEEGRYRIFATSLPCKARIRSSKSYADTTLEEIMRLCAMASSMEYRMFGVNGNAVIPFIIRENEGCASFLHRLLTLEGAVLKCVNGAYTAIDIEYAQARPAAQTFTVYANQKAAEYRREGLTVKSVTVSGPYGKGLAEDRLVGNSHQRIIINGLPVRNNAQAGRWARGKLLHINRSCESVVLPNNYNPGLTAMERVTIQGDTDATGDWLVEDVVHDFINMTSTATLRRCIWTIK